ncbi:hypothetical protein [Cupriavidus necator]|uniref:hypothetical protein n=1 Tax=Cupriavidus necator TaxID=106590 RepID=UPI003F741EB8
MTSALLMVRYLGEKDGTYTVAMVQGPARNTVHLQGAVYVRQIKDCRQRPGSPERNNPRH